MIDPPTPSTSGISPYQLFMLVLSALTLSLLASGVVVQWSDSTRTILTYADTAVCLIFFADFVITLWREPRKLHYLRTWGWIDLLSSIPVIESLRWGRAARVLRILRILRAVKSARTVARFVIERREQSALLASLLMALLLLVCSSVAILEFEVPAGGNITTPEDAMWWAITTMTTVGYGDRYPITSGGRVVAVFLMIGGVGVFAMMSGLIASWFLTPAAREADADLEEIKEHLNELIAIKKQAQQGDQDRAAE